MYIDCSYRPQRASIELRVAAPRLRHCPACKSAFHFVPLALRGIDGTTARGGGRVFRQSGMLLRASQDNSHGVYGWGLNLMEITRLDRDGYAERRIRHVTPDLAPEVMGCHHFDAAGGQYVIDLRLHRPPPPA